MKIGYNRLEWKKSEQSFLPKKGFTMDGIDGIYIAKAAAFIGAAFAMGIGSIGPALGQGNIGTAACENVGKYPESADKIRNTMIIALGIVESSAVYALVISLFLIFKSV